MSVFVNFYGRLGANAEVVTTGSTPFVSCRVAVDENVKKENQTRWITVNGSLESFKNLIPYLTKGKPVLVRGIEHVYPYLSKSGEPCVDTRVWADGIDFISTGKSNESQGQDDSAAKKEEQNSKMTTGGIKKETPAPKEQEMSFVENTDDDLPF